MFKTGSIVVGALLVGLLLPDFCRTASARTADSAPPAEPKAEAAPAGAGELLTRLPNGLAVHVIRDTRFPLVCTRLYVRTGSANEDPKQAGISHVLEHMVFKGSSSRGKGQAAREVESLGGYLNAATSFDKTYYLTDMPAEHWRTGMDVVRSLAFNASFDPKELEAEKNVIISELEGDDDTPSGRLFEALQTAGLKNTVYGRPIIGYKETIRGLTADDLKAYVDRWYQPQNMMLLVAGDVDPRQVLVHAEEQFGLLRNRGELAAPAPIALEDAAGGPRVEVIRGPWNKVYLGVAFPAPALADARSVQLDVLAHVLGGDDTSFLRRKYGYELRLTDSLSVHNMSLSRAGLLTLTANLDAARLEAFWEGLTRDLAALDGGAFPADAVARARFNIADDIDRVGETLNGLASWRGAVEFDMGGRGTERNLRLVLDNVDAAQLRGTAAEWLRPERARVRVLAPQDAVLPDLAAILDRNWPAPERRTADASAAAAGGRERVDLGDGRVLLLEPDTTTPYVAMRMMLPGGNSMLDAEQQGLANLMAATLVDGCGDRGAQDMERFLAERAASLSASAGLQTFAISLTGPARFNNDYFGILRDLLLKPRFEEKELRREADLMIAALRRRPDNPVGFLFTKMNAFLFPSHCYGFDPLGTEEKLKSHDAAAVRALWERQAAMPWVLAVTGSFDRDAVIAFARSLPAPTEAAAAVAAPEWGGERTLAVSLPGRNQAHLAVSYRAVPATHEDAPALTLLQSILSGQSGLLFSDLRDRQGLGYTVTAFLRSMPEAASLVFYIGTTPEKADVARKGFDEVIGRLREDLLPKELLEAGRNRLLGGYHRDRQGLGARAGEAASDAVLGRPADSRRLLLEKTAALTPEDVRRVARKYLAPEGRYEALLRP